MKAIVTKMSVGYFYNFIGCSQLVVYFDMLPDRVIFSTLQCDSSVRIWQL